MEDMVAGIVDVDIVEDMVAGIVDVDIIDVTFMEATTDLAIDTTEALTTTAPMGVMTEEEEGPQFILAGKQNRIANSTLA